MLPRIPRTPANPLAGLSPLILPAGRRSPHLRTSTGLFCFNCVLAVILSFLPPTGRGDELTAGRDQIVAYETQVTPIYADAALSHQIGTLMPGAQLTLRRRNGSQKPLASSSEPTADHPKSGKDGDPPGHGNKTGTATGQSFSLDGWFQEGNDSAVFLAQGKRIITATLTAPDTSYQTISQQKDDYDNVWIQVRLSAYIDPHSLTADQATVWEGAQKLYETRCSACHAVHKPTEFTANQWPAILEIMARNAGLQPTEKALITEFLQTHAEP